MRKTYTAIYRSCLTEEEKKAFKELALKKGSVTEVHDALIREFIKKESQGSKSINIAGSGWSISNNEYMEV